MYHYHKYTLVPSDFTCSSNHREHRHILQAKHQLIRTNPTNTHIHQYNTDMFIQPNIDFYAPTKQSHDRANYICDIFVPTKHSYPTHQIHTFTNLTQTSSYNQTYTSMHQPNRDMIAPTIHVTYSYQQNINPHVPTPL